MQCAVEYIAAIFKKSKFKKILEGGKEIEAYESTSVVSSSVGKALGFCISMTDGIYDTAKNGFILRFINMLKKRSVILNNILSIPFLCAFIFLIPHTFWNNIFGLLISGAILILSAILLPKENRKKPIVWISMLLFATTLVFSTIISYDRADSIRFLLFFASAYILCIGVYLYACNKQRLELLIRWMFIAVFLTSIIALIQRVMGIEADASLTDLSLNSGMPGRAYSTFGNPNNYAEFLVLFLPISFAYALTRKTTNAKVLCLGIAAISTVALVLTYSRSGWIAFAVSVMVFIVLYDKKYFPLLVLLAILAIPLLPESVLNRILTIGNLKDSSSSYRLDIWTGCAKLLNVYWFTGVGLGSGGFMKLFPLFAIGQTGIAPHSHMQFMEMLIELGILGFVVYICFTLSSMRKAFKASNSSDKLLKALATALAAAMSGIILIGFFEYCWFYPRVLLAFFVCIGIVLAITKLSKESHI